MKQLQLTETTFEIACAIRCFPTPYHEDFVRTREAAKRYFARSSEMATSDLARELVAALRSWGANKRKAPQLLTENDICAALKCENRRKRLRDLALYSINELSVGPDGAYKTVGEGLKIDKFNELLFASLRDASTAFFVGNTNVTYPMKALLLINGQMPAFDSQVRNGLKKSGIEGFSAGQYLMPSTPNVAGARKILELPFVLGEVWSSGQEQIREALRLARRSELAQEPGRFFDMLLFIQGGKYGPALLSSKV